MKLCVSIYGAPFGLHSIRLAELFLLIVFLLSIVFCSFSLIKARGKIVLLPDFFMVPWGCFLEELYPSSLNLLLFCLLPRFLEIVGGLSIVLAIDINGL